MKGSPALHGGTESVGNRNWREGGESAGATKGWGGGEIW